MKDFGEEGIQIIKVKGHLKKREVEAGKISRRDWRGNDEADRLANKGARRAAQLAPKGIAMDRCKRRSSFTNGLRSLRTSGPRTRHARRRKTGGAGDWTTEAGKDISKLPPLHRGRPHAWWHHKQSNGK